VDGQPADSLPLSWFAGPHARSWACGSAEAVRSGAVRAFHEGLPGYAPAPPAPESRLRLFACSGFEIYRF